MTNFYDFNIKPNEEVIETLEKFDFTGACIFYDSNNYDDEIIAEFNQLRESTTLDLYHGVRVSDTNAQILSKKILKFDRKVDLIMADAYNDKVNRTICQMRQVDILNNLYQNKYDRGLNHVLSKLLKENNITVNIDYRNILNNRGYHKAKLLAKINRLFMLQRKYGFRVITSSGSNSFYDVKSPRAMLSLTNLFDIDMDYAKKLNSTNVDEIIEDITIHNESIVEGVRIIKD